MRYLLNWFKRRYYCNVHEYCGNEMCRLCYPSFFPVPSLRREYSLPSSSTEHCAEQPTNNTGPLLASHSAAQRVQRRQQQQHATDGEARKTTERFGNYPSRKRASLKPKSEPLPSKKALRRFTTLQTRLLSTRTTISCSCISRWIPPKRTADMNEALKADRPRFSLQSLVSWLSLRLQR